MKLIIQIPCYNEAQTIGLTLSELPRQVQGFDSVEWLIVNDGSTDETVAAAKAAGADHIVSFTRNQGLAKAFLLGLDACLKLGADVIVNTDADNQYKSADIPGLVQPILEGRADIVVGARDIDTIRHFSFFKKILQKLGSGVVKIASNTDIPDAPSGFRALSRDAAMRLNVFNDFTYTLETIIQAGQKNMAITWVPIRTNPFLRPSRLFKSTWRYMKNSIFTIIRIFVVYKPFSFFLTSGISVFLAGFLIGLRFIYYMLRGDGGGHVQSLILASVLLGIGFQTIIVSFLADLQAVNRKMLEELSYKLKKVIYERDRERRESLLRDIAPRNEAAGRSE